MSDATESTTSTARDHAASSDTDLEAHGVAVPERKHNGAAGVEKDGHHDEQQRDKDGVKLQDGIPVVGLSGPEDPFSPLNMSKKKKWIIVTIISSAALCVTCCSSMVALSYAGTEQDFGVDRIMITFAGLTCYILALGFFPLLVGPLSEFYGRRPIYNVSFFFFFALNFLVAFSNNVVAYAFGRFLTGAAGAAFMSVSGGTVSDVFESNRVAAPMGFYTSAPFLGPILGPLISGFINQHLHWRWTWYILLMWAAAEYVVLLLFVPETFLPALLKRKAKRLRQEGRTDVRAPLELDERSIPKVIGTSCLRPFLILATEPMAAVLCAWTSLLLGILYMSFSAWAIVYGGTYGFNTQEIGLSFCGLGLGVIIGECCHPFWQRSYERVARETGGRPPPEEHLRKGLAAVVIAPISLFWFAFTTYPSIPWYVSQIATIPFGIACIWAFQSVFVYLVDYLRPVAASAMAANSATRSIFGGAFPLFATQMFRKLGNQGALALCAGLCVAIVPFPFLFFRYGARLRRASRFANL